MLWVRTEREPSAELDQVLVVAEHRRTLSRALAEDVLAVGEGRVERVRLPRTDLLTHEEHRRAGRENASPNTTRDRASAAIRVGPMIGAPLTAVTMVRAVPAALPASSCDSW